MAAVFDPQVYGEPVFSDLLIAPEVYGEEPLAGGGPASFTFTLSAVLKKTASPTFTLDAVLSSGSATISGSFTLNSVFKKSISGTFTLNAVLRKNVASTKTLNAVLRKIPTATKTLNAVLKKSASSTLTLNAVIACHFSLNAIFKGATSTSFTLSAHIRFVPVPPTQVKRTFIRVNNVDIADDVIFADAEFTAQVNGQPGTARLRVRDLQHTHSFSTGDELQVYIGDVVVWGGWLTKVMPGYAFKVDDTEEPQLTDRIWVLEGVDYNILFSKRFLINKAHPTQMITNYPVDSFDSTIVLDLISRYLYLEADGLDTGGVTHVGTPNPDQGDNVGNPGDSWGAAMTLIARYTAAIFYIDPNRVLYFVDDDTPNAPFALSDTPSPSQVGYREMEIMLNGTKLVNDALVWGAGTGSINGLVTFSRSQDATSISDHGRWQLGEFTTNLFKQASVDNRATSYVYGSPQNLRGGKDDAISVQLTVFEPGLVAGMKINFTSDVFGYSDVLPIRRMRLTFPTGSDPEFALTLSHEVDQPWASYEFFFPPINFTFTEPHIDFPPPVLPPPGGEDCGITDTFNRDELVGWGIADCGLTWQPTSGAFITSIPGFLLQYDNGSSWTGGAIDLPIPALDIDLSATFSFNMAVASAPAEGFFNIRLGPENPPFGFDFVGIGFGSNVSTVSARRLAFGGGGTTDSVPFTFDSSKEYMVRVSLTSTQTRVKVWRIIDAEPGAWTATATVGTGATRFTDWNILLGSHLKVDGGEVGVRFFNLDIAGVDRCSGGPLGDPVIIDDWSREITVASYDGESFPGDAFGTSSSGTPWWNNGFTSGGEGTMGVTGGTGVITAKDHSFDPTYGDIRANQLNFAMIDFGDPLDPMNLPDVLRSDYEGTIRFRLGAIPHNNFTPGSDMHIDVIAERFNPDTNADVQMDFRSTIIDPPVNFSLDIRLSNARYIDDAFVWLADVWYTLKWQFNRNFVQAKLWHDSQAEPDWMVSSPGDGDPGPNAGGEFEAQPRFSVDISPPESNEIPLIEWDDFIATPMSSTGTGIPPAGYVCEQAVRTDSTHYQLSNTYVEATTEVYVNGLYQRPGIAREYTESTPETGIILFNDPISDPAADVSVCYYANGSL